MTFPTRVSLAHIFNAAYAYAHGGRLSGEHGIGSKKAHFLERFTPSGELELMRKIKKAWDPNNILNPGKVFNL